MTPYQVTQELQQAALRMQLCHKACEGIPTESLVAHGVVAYEEVVEIIKQRDALFDALKFGLPLIEFYDGRDNDEAKAAHAAIALVPTKRIIRQGIFKGNGPSERPHHPADFNGVVFNKPYRSTP